MLASARERELHERLLEADVRTTGLGEDAYDLAVCCLVDEHLDRLAPLYTEASRLLRAEGHFVLVGYHPFFLMATGMPTHFDHPERGPVAIETHLHLFEEHHAAARESGFVPLELHEGVVDDEWVRRKPSWEERRGWPISFAWAFRAAC
jgi:SAM-dependent methyltransferase